MIGNTYLVVFFPPPRAMLRSLILTAVLLTSQAAALNSTYAYVSGYFAQDDPQADPNAIGAVGGRNFRTPWGLKLKARWSLVAARAIRIARFQSWTLAKIPTQYHDFELRIRTTRFDQGVLLGETWPRFPYVYSPTRRLRFLRLPDNVAEAEYGTPVST